MDVDELLPIVIFEAFLLAGIITGIVFCYQRVLLLVVLISMLTHVGFFLVWEFPFALGAMLIYGPISILLWLDLDYQIYDSTIYSRYNRARISCWLAITTGIFLIFSHNILKIINYIS